MVNSGSFDGLSVEEGKAKITAYMKEHGIGEGTVNFRLRDWLISRQRYWELPSYNILPSVRYGTGARKRPAGITAHRCGVFALSGESPLNYAEDFYKTSCPVCGGDARRETDTMDTFVCSSWYFDRYCSPHETELPFTREATDYWMAVDQYIGGVEHAILHLMYARFFTKFLYDIKMLSVGTFALLTRHGIKDGAKMSKLGQCSKSRRNYQCLWSRYGLALFYLHLLLKEIWNGATKAWKEPTAF